MDALNTYDFLLILAFIIGYVFITIEHVTHINKTAVALLMATVCWVIQFSNTKSSYDHNFSLFGEHIFNISQIIFFLLGALTIVEIISAHQGFKMISDAINIHSKKKLLWVIGFLTFFLSAILDNLTTTIIMVTLIRKLIQEGEERLLIGGAIVIAANAGGAWTPIGDVTTTMLWIGGQLSTFKIIKDLFLPSLTCLIVSLACIGWALKGEFLPLKNINQQENMEPKGKIIFWLGIACLVLVPVFKILTGLPPFMGMIFGLGLMWLFTDIVHHRYDNRAHLRVPQIISRIDISGVLFFLGILLAVNSLEAAGILGRLAQWMNQVITNPSTIAIAIGLASAVIDNVPLVAAVMGMYDLSQYPMDSYFWELIAYCAGTGGSILVIGSAAGVAFMGLERVQFFWYLRRIGLAALVGYFAGIGVFEIIN
jgi:NhaD family Na+/H+ antiporter